MSFLWLSLFGPSKRGMLVFNNEEKAEPSCFKRRVQPFFFEFKKFRHLLEEIIYIL